MLLALHILLDTLAPAEQAPAVRALLGAITNDPVLCIVIAAALTWAAHSSVAVVLLVMSLAYSHSSRRRRRSRWCSAPISAARSIRCSKAAPAAIRRAGGCRVGNLINRLVGMLHRAAVPASDRARIGGLQPDAAKMTAEFHMLFNVALAAIFIGPLDARGGATGAHPAGAEAAGRSLGAALSRRGRARNAAARARQCRARDAAHGRHRRGDAARGDDGADDQRPQAGRPTCRGWTTSSTGSTKRSSSTSPS